MRINFSDDSIMFWTLSTAQGVMLLLVHTEYLGVDL